MTDGPLHFDASGVLHRPGARFDPLARRWVRAARPGDGRPVPVLEALRRIAAQLRPQRPIGVVGPRRASDAQAAAAEDLGARLADLGLVVLCGGRGGVMEAVCAGVRRGGGVAIGLLDAPDWAAANPHVGIALPTGTGSARNALIARAAEVVVAVGGGHGTLSEIAFALQFGRPVLTLCGAPEPEGVQPCADVEAALLGVARAVLRLGPDGVS